MVNLESVCDKVEKDNELGIWDENQDYGKILYFSSSRILVKKMGKRWSHRRSRAQPDREPPDFDVLFKGKKEKDSIQTLFNRN